MMRVAQILCSMLILLSAVRLVAQKKIPTPSGLKPPIVMAHAPSVQPPTNPTSDPQAVAIVQNVITAMGGATAIMALHSWTFQAQAQGHHSNGSVTEHLAAKVPQNSKQPGTTAKAPPPWAQPRSSFVPALAGAILANESQDANFVLMQGVAPASMANTNVVVVLAKSTSGTSALAQRWYFDKTRNLPSQIDFILPARIGLVEGLRGTVILSNYENVGGLLYPFQIATFLQHEHATQTITLQSVTPSTAAPNTASGGAQ